MSSFATNRATRGNLGTSCLRNGQLKLANSRTAKTVRGMRRDILFRDLTTVRALKSYLLGEIPRKRGNHH
jgi:hypothetical protein